MDKQNGAIGKMEYFSALKTKGILTPATWMNLDDIMLSEISQAQKDTHCVVPLTWGTESGQIQTQQTEQR